MEISEQRADTNRPGPARLARHVVGNVYEHGGRFLRSLIRDAVLRRPKRTPDDTKLDFSQPWAWAAFTNVSDFDAYVFRDKGTTNYVLLDGRLTWARQSEPMRRFLPHLKEVIEQYVGDPSTATVLEFGCGNGHNLLYLARQFPGMKLIGIDIAAPRIETARRAAQHFGLDVEFHVGDVTKPQPGLPNAVDVCYTVAAIEQMPRVYPAAVDAIAARARKAVLLFEPIPEMWPRTTWLGIMSRIRAASMDYMRGLPGFLAARGYRVAKMTLLDYADDPYNPITEIHVVPAPAGTSPRV